MFKKLAASLASALSFASCVPMVDQNENLKQGAMPAGHRPLVETGSSSGNFNSYGGGGRVTRRTYDPNTGQYTGSVISGRSYGNYSTGRATFYSGGPNGYSSVTIGKNGVYFNNRYRTSRYDLKRLSVPQSTSGSKDLPALILDLDLKARKEQLP